MYSFLIGLVVGGAACVLSYMLGHAIATRDWKFAVDSLTRAKLKLEDEVVRLKLKL